MPTADSFIHGQSHLHSYMQSGDVPPTISCLGASLPGYAPSGKDWKALVTTLVRTRAMHAAFMPLGDPGDGGDLKSAHGQGALEWSGSCGWLPHHQRRTMCSQDRQRSFATAWEPVVKNRWPLRCISIPAFGDRKDCSMSVYSQLERGAEPRQTNRRFMNATSVLAWDWKKVLRHTRKEAEKEKICRPLQRHCWQRGHRGSGGHGSSCPAAQQPADGGARRRPPTAVVEAGPAPTCSATGGWTVYRVSSPLSQLLLH